MTDLGRLHKLLVFVLLVLKLSGTVSWSWWWVLAPLWIPVGAVLLLLTFIGAVILLGGLDAIGY